MRRIPSRLVYCHRCSTNHPVSPHARSTICPSCNAAIELTDREFRLPASLPVDTRGKLTVGPGATLSSSWIICGSAHIAGQIIGTLRSEGEVRLATNRVCACEVTAPVVVIEKNALANFTLPVETDRLVVRGHLTGIVHCRGVVHVLRGGCLEAEVHARSVKVDKGGILLGSCRVNGTEPAQPLRNEIPDNDITRGWTSRLCPAY